MRRSTGFIGRSERSAWILCRCLLSSAFPKRGGSSPRGRQDPSGRESLNCQLHSFSSLDPRSPATDTIMGVSEFLKDVANDIGKKLRQEFSTTGSRGRGRSPARSGPRPPEARHGSGRGRSASPVHSSSQTSEQGSSAFLKYLRERGEGRGPWVKTEGGYALLDENGRTIDTRPSSGGKPPQSKSDDSRLPESFYHSYFPNTHPKAALCETCGERQVTSGGPPQELTDETDGPLVFGLPYICDEVGLNYYCGFGEPHCAS